MFGVNLDRKHIENFDLTLFLTMLVITVIGGVVAIYSAGYDPVTATVKKYYVRQGYWLIIGYFMFFFFSSIGHKKLVKYSYIIYVLGILVLVAVLVLGGHVGMGGAKRWIAFGGLRIQPSEVFKFIWVIFLARLYLDISVISSG